MYNQGSRFKGNTVTAADDAVNHHATWTLDELETLRDYWPYFELRDIALSLGRSEAACMAMFYWQRRRPPIERFTPAAMERSAFGGNPKAHDPGPDLRPVHTEPDEDAWWEPNFYRRNVAG